MYVPECRNEEYGVSPPPRFQPTTSWQEARGQFLEAWSRLCRIDLPVSAERGPFFLQQSLDGVEPDRVIRAIRVAIVLTFHFNHPLQ